MNKRWTLIAVGLVGTIVGFLMQSNGPVGKSIWPLASGMPEPEGAVLGLLIGMGVIEALAFGVGCAFLVGAWPWVRARSAGAWSLPVYLSVAWVLVNWVPHTALHMSHGNVATPDDYLGLAGIEYGFHFTLIVTGAILATYVVRSVATQVRPTDSRPQPTPAPMGRKST